MAFSPEALAALHVPGVAERWHAVQAHLHPELAQLAEQVAAAAQTALPRQWVNYELSYKSQRSVQRGPGRREPIGDYWVAFDRPPRGAGVLVAVSAAEQAILVGLQLWGARKPALTRLWELARPVWTPLVERIAQHGQVRFAQRKLDPAAPEGFWIDHYLANSRAGYLWAGFVYPWDALPSDLTARLVADVLALLPLNEALMEQVEAQLPLGVALLREQPGSYALPGLPPVEVLIEQVRTRGFTINELTLRSYHLALQTRPLVILPGISGTGKTRLTRLYADAVYNIAPGRLNPYYLLVAVQPDWHNARDLLGYYNALTGSYHATPFLRFMLQAAADPQQPYYVCLDELNLARPEYYLAPLLSAMETSDGLLDLGTPVSEVPLVGGGFLQNPLRLPLNLRLTGTVNVDESTFVLSDKLLDRANVIALTDVDLAGFRANYPGPLDTQIWAVLVALHQSMTVAGHAFGYRTLGEILRFIEQAQGTLSPLQALDLQINQRILPRIRGEEGPRLRRLLNELLSQTLGCAVSVWQRAALVTAEQLAAAPYPESAARLRRMLERLDQEGFTDFYG
ncbi:MAG: GTPase [Candidatus Viridilinea halotolerans]|uniref:GTPase n=1 Tax=Candidatus Viridilinea halotolerans TaxID=2491704 RepID=A0A426TUN6_9CHLR|nr:MAG: GTPase [Candidatus Viridilinea halotolerans]